MTAHQVCRADDLPAGRRRLVTINGREIAVLNVEGTFYAVRNRCCHQGGPVGLGAVTTTVTAEEALAWQPTRRSALVIRCPWHGLEFDLTSGCAVGDPRWRVRTYPIRVVEGTVEVVLPTPVTPPSPR